jgi:LPS export ABC transporter protein LptC
MNWRWISIAALLAALVAGLGAFMRRDPSEVLSVQAPPQPGYFLRDAIITQTEKDGSPGIRLIAQRIDQKSTEGTIQLSTVQVDFLRTADRQWMLTADRGFVAMGSRVIQFNGNVHLRPLDDTTTASLRTNALALDTVKNIAYSTQSPVDIRFGTVAMKVKRFEADLTSEKVKLESIQGRTQRGG